MRTVLLAALLTFTAAAQPQTNNGVIQGVVRRIGTGEPIVGVQVSLNTSTPASARAAVYASLGEGIQIPSSIANVVSGAVIPGSATRGARGTALRSVTTDERGQFSFENVPDGQFVVSAFRENFVVPKSESTITGTT